MPVCLWGLLPVPLLGVAEDFWRNAMMNLNRLMKLADKPHTLEVMRSVVFDGRDRRGDG
jgi:hypothetical protein